MSADIKDLVLSRDADERSAQDLSADGVKISFRNAAYFQKAEEAPVSFPRYFSVPFRERIPRGIDGDLPSRTVTKDLIDMRYQPPQIELPNQF
jgi:hypothetical protein